MKNIFILLITAAVFTSCSSSDSKDKKAELAKLKKESAAIQDKINALETALAATDTTISATEIAVTEIQPGLFQHFIEVQAKVDGDENVAISADMPGTVTRINVKVGDKVAKGTIMAELDAAAILKQLEEVEVGFNFMKTKYEKQKALWDQKVGSEIQYLGAKSEYESMAKRSAMLREQLDMMKIKSPINGTVDAVDIKIGQAVSPASPAIRVVNLTNLKVKAEVAEAYVSKVNAGNDVVIVFPDIKTEVKSKLSYAGKVIDALNRTFRVEVNLAASEASLHPNMVAVLKIADYKSEQAFSVPVNLVNDSESGQYIYIADESGGKKKAKRVMVKTGQTYNGTVEIIEGLAAGDKVITTGYQDLIDGELLKF